MKLPPLAVLLTGIFLIILPSWANGEQSKAQIEDYYAQIWCQQMGGVSEHRTSMGTRVDCLTRNYAVEVDFDYKWAEGIGQALHYGALMRRRSAVLLIVIDHTGRDRSAYIKRARHTILANDLPVELFFIFTSQYPTR